MTRLCFIATLAVAVVASADVRVATISETGDKVPAVVTIIDSNGREYFPPFANLAPGPVTVVAKAPGYVTVRRKWQATANATLTLTMAFDTGEVIEIVDEPPLQDEIVSISRETITLVPGAGSDPLKAIQNFPGVGRTPVGLGGLILRGSSPRDTSVYIDGIRVPILYHFGGLTSFMPVEMLDDVKLSAGGFGVSYGRAQGGLVEVSSRSPRADDPDYAFEGEISLIDARAYAAAPLADGSFKVAIRRSYIDAILAAVPLGDEVDLTVAPQYYDGQVMWSRSFRRVDLKALSFFSLDRTALEVESDNGSTGGFSLTQGFWRVGLPSTVHLTDDWKIRSTIFTGQDTADISVSDSFTRYSVLRYGLRSEVTQTKKQTLRFTAGIDYEGGRFVTDLDNNLPRGLDPAQQGNVRVNATNFTNDVGLYSKLTWTPLKGFEVEPGVRFDYFDRTGEFVVNPRIKATQTFGPLRWISQVGLYHQPPVPADVAEQFGNPELRSSNSVQLSSGLRTEWTGGEARLEGFYEVLDDQQVDVISGATPLANSRYGGGLGSFTLEANRELYGSWSYQDNEGIGRNYGFEVFLRHKAEKWFGWLSYTYARSLRRDDPNWLPDYHVGVLDQPHTFTGVFAYKLPRNWIASTRVRLVSGYPFTPVDSAYYDTDQGQYQPVSSRLLADRVPMFFQWDIRIQKTWKWPSTELVFYLDVQNVTNRKNPEGVRYDYDYRNRAYTNGLPIFPSLGLEVKL